MIETSFACLKCGICCRSLKTKQNPFSLGLFLFPKEAELLNQLGEARNVKLTIFPQQGVTTKRETDVKKPEKVFSYQLADPICPFLDGETNKCAIYDQRPVACRAFPVLTPSPLVLIPECAWVKNNVPSLRPYVPMPWAGEGLDDEIRNASRITNWNLKWLKDAREVWVFDLQTKRWILASTR
jgi:Fe-S-cluster containining protein